MICINFIKQQSGVLLSLSQDSNDIIYFTRKDVILLSEIDIKNFLFYHSPIYPPDSTAI